MPDFVLHCFAQSGNAYKVALMLNLCGSDWQAKFVDFFNGETRTPEWRAEVNEMGEVPVLEHGAIKLTQSGIILDYVSAQSSSKFGPGNPDERREMWRWILWDNHKFTNYIATYRFMKVFAKTGDTPVTDFLWGRAKAGIEILNAHLDGREWVAADRPTLADLSLCGYLFYEDEIGVSWSDDYPNIAAWLDRIRAQEGWKHPYDLMPGHPLPGA